MNLEALFDSAISARDEGQLPDALGKVLELLAQAPDSPRGKLLLANLYYLSGCVELAAGEVAKLYDQYPDRESLVRLLKALDPSFVEEEAFSEEDVSTDEPSGQGEPAKEPAEESKVRDAVLAETDFEFDDLDLLGDED